MLYRKDTSVIRELFNSGDVFAYPTEAVWGVGCDPFNEAAIKKVLQIKSRPAHKGLIIVTGQIKWVEPLLLALPTYCQDQAKSLWPGPETLIVPDPQGYFNSLIKGDHDSVAIRVSAHPFIRWFSDNIGPFLVSTSANMSGQAPCRHSWQVSKRLSHKVNYIVKGRTSGGLQPSRITHLLTGDTLRALSAE